MFYSQAGQDLWVLQKIGNKGFFVDVGAHDGIESSNTYALEKAGWTGICIEPNEAVVNRLQLNRKCTIGPYAVVSEGDFCLKVILDRISAPLIIEYLSIDVDGTELDILKGMNFNKYHVRLITIEHNQYLEGEARQEEIFKYLVSQGFTRVVKDVKCLDGEWFGKVYEDWYKNIGMTDANF